MKIKQLLAGILAWAFVLPALAAPDHGDVPLAESLQAEGLAAQQRKVPIMLVFTAPTCPYCERVKAEYLGPMMHDPAYSDKVIIRQIEVGSDWTLAGFDGRKTTHGAYAASQKIAMVPTIKVIDAQGRELAKPIVGYLTPDYYFGYIQDAMNEGLDRMRKGSGSRN